MALLDQETLLSTRLDVIRFLIERDGDYCYLCDDGFERDHDEDFSEYTIDHVIPRSRGGLDHVENYRVTHLHCNQDKADRMWLPDGTLEPKPIRRRSLPKAERPDLCTTCINGRMLQRGAYCPSCGCEAGPQPWPWWAKAPAHQCRHDETNWCWACGALEIYPRSAPLEL